MEHHSCEQNAVEKIIEEIKLNNMTDTVLHFNHLHRYTGYPQAEEAVQYITKNLKSYGIPYEKKEYEAYIGLPLEAFFSITEPEKMEFPVIADAFSGSVTGMQGEICCIDMASWDEEHLRACRGKILLTDMGGEAATEAGRYGAKAFIHTSISGGNVIHHRTAGTVWGNPDLDALGGYSDIAAMSIGKEDGEWLRELLRHKKVVGKCSVRMDSSVKKSTMPIVKIPGKTEKYILVSGHYDSWYEGITDNATSDAILLELARVFWLHREKLSRGVCFAWWSGHSDGRYAGSAWYCDNQWEDLGKNCMAHINLDLCGCRGADRVTVRTAGMEVRRFTKDVIERFTGKSPGDYTPMIRGADQSFWGVNIPISIMLKYEPEQKERISPCPGGGAWWHTAEDTLDKMTPDFLMRDARMNGIMAASLCVKPVLPVDIPVFLAEMKCFLGDIEKELPPGLLPEFDLSPIKERFLKMEPVCFGIQKFVENGKADDAFIKKTAGELVRITYTEKGKFEQDRAIASKPFPGFYRAVQILKNENAGVKYLAAKTTFMRQCNRLKETLDRVKEYMEERLMEWEESNERED